MDENPAAAVAERCFRLATVGQAIKFCCLRASPSRSVACDDMDRGHPRWLRRPQHIPAPGWTGLASTIADQVDVSVLMEYWGGARSRTVAHAEGAADFIRDVGRMLRQSTRLSFEILVNSDSRHVRHGDARTLLAALGTTGFLLLSPNLGVALTATLTAHPRHPPPREREGAPKEADTDARTVQGAQT